MKRLLFLIALLYCQGILPVFAQTPSFSLRAPWDAGDWWQPSTYDGHPAPGTHKAMDLNRVQNVRSSWPFADEIDDAGANIRAAHSGTVTLVPEKDSKGYGNLVKLKSSEDGQYETYYAHLQDYSVANGQRVNKGDILGHCGKTGNADGTHLHFEIRLNGSAIVLDGISLSGQAIDVDYSQKDGLGRYRGCPIKAPSDTPLSDYYIDATDGNDGNTGNPDSPLKTISQALTLSQGNSVTLHLRAGTFKESGKPRPLSIKQQVNIKKWDGSGNARIAPTG